MSRRQLITVKDKDGNVVVRTLFADLSPNSDEVRSMLRQMKLEKTWRIPKLIPRNAQTAVRRKRASDKAKARWETKRIERRAVQESKAEE